MEKRIYFIYSNNRERDSEFARKLHLLLPAEIDIVEGKFKRGKLINFKGEVIGTSELLKMTEMPFCITESAYMSLMDKEGEELPYMPQDLIEIMSVRQDRLNEVYGMCKDGRLKCGEKNIRKLIEDLRSYCYAWPP